MPKLAADAVDVNRTRDGRRCRKAAGLLVDAEAVVQTEFATSKNYCPDGGPDTGGQSFAAAAAAVAQHRSLSSRNLPCSSSCCCCCCCCYCDYEDPPCLI